jgi:hypothetical protein
MKKKSQKLNPENSDKKLSLLIEKLNAELKVMNEINSKLTSEKKENPNHKIPKPRKSNINLKTNGK